MRKFNIFAGVILMALTNAIASDDSRFLSHNLRSPFDLTAHEDRIRSSTNLVLSVDETLELLHQAASFELGQFLLENGGLNGYWIAYIILHGLKKEDLHPSERWVLEQSPSVLATRERFGVFQKKIQERLKSQMTLASIPCGLMDDLLGLDYSNTTDIQLVGIDLDPNSLALAQENADSHKMIARFMQKDAWDLGVSEAYDLITSNGLNIYEPSDEKVTALYKQFWHALKSDGILITSFMTPPPWPSCDLSALQKQRALFCDVLQVALQSFRTEEKTRQQLADAGFDVIDVIYDSARLFPTVIAQKSHV